MSDTLPFDSKFQGALFKILLEDNHFSNTISPHVEKSYFENPVHSWAWEWAQWYRAKYACNPTLHAIINGAKESVPASHIPEYQATLGIIQETQITDQEFVQDKTLDFIQRQVFRRAVVDSTALFNVGQIEESYDRMRTQMDHLAAIETGATQKEDRQWYCEEFAERQNRRMNSVGHDPLGMGMPALDAFMGGGLIPGQLAVFLAHPKKGKTTVLANAGAHALRTFRKVLHIPLEGSGAYIADRLDTIMSQQLYSAVRAGHIESDAYQKTMAALTTMKGNYVIRSFTDGWSTNAEHIWSEVRALKRDYDWEPDLIIVDYCDLLEARNPAGMTTTESQKHAFQDLKTLANKGNRVLTASQVQRPRNKEFNDEQEILKSADIADCYAKVRIADFVGSVNQTAAEREQKIMRMHLELARDTESDATFPVYSDFSRMTICGDASAAVQEPLNLVGHAQGNNATTLGYQQRRMGV